MSSMNPQLLLVAADPTLRFTLEEVLTYYGYHVTSAASAPAAQALTAAGCYELLITVQILPTAAIGDARTRPDHAIDDVLLTGVAP
ncbi:MAG TPA: hypothetical protein VFX76_09585 [Roseiflexaceae bacterium]|nr:hypothetical protein [Roseiflexaceae bacterium]